MAFSKYVITNAGRDLMLACMATGNFKIHSLVLGSGSYSGILSEIQDVVEPVLIFSGDTLSVVKRENQLEVRCRLTNEQLESGFQWREYGVYATDGENTVLYCYDNAGNDPVPISSAGSGAAVSNAIKVIIAADQAATVNVSFKPDAEIAVDDEVTENGKNPVSSAAVWEFAGGGVPLPTASDKGKALVVGEDGKYKLGEVGISEVSADMVKAGTFAGAVKANPAAAADITAAQVRNIVGTTTDPGAGTASSYPNGTVVLVYE